MANLIQATVYQIDGAPLSSPITVDFRTSDIVVREASINIAAVNSAIQYYNVPNNALSVKTYYVSDTIAQLVSDANEGLITQVQVTVLEINNDPVVDGGIQYSFPSNEILVGEVLGSPTGINSTITFKNDVYSVAETQATILAAVNDLSQFILNEGGVPSFQANTLANLPLPGNAGKMFISTDTYAFYRDNGLGWDLIGGPGIGTVTGSGVATQVAFWNGTSVISGSSNLFWDGVNARLGIGTSSPAQQLDLTGSARIQTIANATTDTDRFLVSDAGVIKYRTGAEVLSDIGAPAGTGTTNYLVKWTGTTALGNSLVFDNGTNVGIGTTSPTSGKLQIDAGSTVPIAALTSNLDVAQYFASGSYAGFRIIANSNNVPYIGLNTSNSVSTYNVGTQRAFFAYWGDVQGYASLGYGSSTHAIVFRTNNGNVILGGGTTDAGYKLDVSGTFRSTGDANINGLTVGKGGGSVATNTAVGSSALNANTTGVRNTAIGSGAGAVNTTSSDNTYIGNNAGQSATGQSNTAIGANSADRLTSGANNTFVGRTSGYATTTGGANVYVGMQAGYDGTTGGGNVAIGYNTGRGITTGNYNTIIGSEVTGLSSSLSNTIILADGQGNQRLYINSSGNVGLGGGTADATYKMTVGGIFQFVTGSSFFGMSSGNLTLNNWGAYINNQSTSFSFLGQIAGANIGSFTGSSTAVTINSITNLPLRFLTNNTEVGRFFANGNFAIGTTTDAGYKLDVNGTARVQSDLTLRNGYTLGNSFVSARLGIVSSSATNSFIDLYPNAVTGNSDVGFTVWSKGSPSNITNYELLEFRYDNTNRRYSMNSIASGTGSVLPMIFYTGTNTSQLYLNTNGNIGIGTTSPNASALLDVSSTTKGFLPPRMTNAQMVAIATPAAGLVVYDTTNNKLNVYDGTNWVAVH